MNYGSSCRYSVRDQGSCGISGIVQGPVEHNPDWHFIPTSRCPRRAHRGPSPMPGLEVLLTGPGLPDIDAEGPDAITQCSMNASTRFPRIGTGELRVCERTRAWSLS